MKADSEKVVSAESALAEHNTALRFPIKPRQFIHGLWQIRCNYHIKGSTATGEESLYSGPIIRGGVHERNRGEFLAVIGRGRKGEEAKEESRCAVY